MCFKLQIPNDVARLQHMNEIISKISSDAMKLARATESLTALLQNNPEPMLRCFLASDFFLAPITRGGHDAHISEDAFKTELFFAFDAGRLMAKADIRLEMKLQSAVFLPPPHYFHRNFLRG